MTQDHAQWIFQHYGPAAANRYLERIGSDFRYSAAKIKRPSKYKDKTEKQKCKMQRYRANLKAKAEARTDDILKGLIYVPSLPNSKRDCNKLDPQVKTIPANRRKRKTD